MLSGSYWIIGGVIEFLIFRMYGFCFVFLGMWEFFRFVFCVYYFCFWVWDFRLVFFLWSFLFVELVLVGFIVRNVLVVVEEFDKWSCKYSVVMGRGYINFLYLCLVLVFVDGILVIVFIILVKMFERLFFIFYFIYIFCFFCFRVRVWKVFKFNVDIIFWFWRSKYD